MREIAQSINPIYRASTNVFTNQGHLEKVVHKLFRGEKILTNVKKEANLINPINGQFFELDVWIPDRKLSFEFQDPHHYVSTWYCQVPLSEIQHLDNLKQELLHNRGENLIVVPCWWDGTKESLLATIHQQRPDVLPAGAVDDDIATQHQRDGSSSSPIPSIPPANFFMVPKIPGVGEMMLASFPIDIDFTTSSIRPDTPWWMGEKYDGIRCCWNPLHAKLYMRSGLELVLPHTILEALCKDIFLDAEIWYGRGGFSESRKLIQSSTYPTNLAHLRIVAFDNPATELQSFAFESRYQSLLENISPNHSFIIIAMRTLVGNQRRLSKSIQNITENGGEGVVLRQPGSIYEHGRSNSLLKLKAARGDREALVVEVEEDAVTLKLPSGLTFKVPTKDVKAIPKPVRGDVVTFEYQGLSLFSMPVRPSIPRVRTDLAWDDVVAQWIREAPRMQILNESSEKIVNSYPKTYGYWVHAKRKHLRLFFEKIATAFMNFDPLIPENWYTVSLPDIYQKKGVISVLKHFKGSLVKALLYLFPDIGLEEHKFPFRPKNYWKSTDNRRSYFEFVAKQNGFDPLVPHNWYQFHSNLILPNTVANVVQKYYDGSLRKALLHIFPEIGLDTKEFLKGQAIVVKTRNFFLQVANDAGFDPLVPHNWYNISMHSLSLKYKGVRQLLLLYQGSVSKALMLIFPNIGLKREGFAKAATLATHRKLFDSIAHQEGFNPLVASNWYTCDSEFFYSKKGLSGVVSHYGGFIKALQAVYPELDINAEKFSTVPRGFWSQLVNQRAFFDNFAKENGFDSQSATYWHTIKTEYILAKKGGASLLAYYKGSLMKALKTNYPHIGLHEHKYKYWQNIANRKAFFDTFACQKGFDPLIPNNWYLVSSEAISLTKGASAVLNYHRGSFIQALLDLYPNIGINQSQFSVLPKHYWHDMNNRRIFLEQFARERGINPYVPSDWNKISPTSIMESKAASMIMHFYQGNVTKALLSLFPNVSSTNR